MKKKLVNTLKQFIETTNDRRLAEHIRRKGTDEGYEPFTSYRLGKDCGISLNTVYNLVNRPDRIPSEKVLKKIAEFYLAQPSELLALVDASDSDAD